MKSVEPGMMRLRGLHVMAMRVTSSRYNSLNVMSYVGSGRGSNPLQPYVHHGNIICHEKHYTHTVAFARNITHEQETHVLVSLVLTWQMDNNTRGSVCLVCVHWIPFGDHPLKLERYRED